MTDDLSPEEAEYQLAVLDHFEKRENRYQTMKSKNKIPELASEWDRTIKKAKAVKQVMESYPEAVKVSFQYYKTFLEKEPQQTKGLQRVIEILDNGAQMFFWGKPFTNERAENFTAYIKQNCFLPPGKADSLNPE